MLIFKILDPTISFTFTWRSRDLNLCRSTYKLQHTQKQKQKKNKKFIIFFFLFKQLCIMNCKKCKNSISFT